ncbi:MAG: hypothetical protein ACNI3C_04055 [Candidatus Marinarcus sp.]|uniref:hypothetical protein n=1 Tax=Candidatus Marinarcus sp. TaxID=3100987 RepID=UPI003B0048EF
MLPYLLLLSYSLSAYFLVSSWNDDIVNYHLFTFLQVLLSIILFGISIFIKINYFEKNRTMYIIRNQPLYKEIEKENFSYILILLICAIISFTVPKYINARFNNGIINEQTYKVIAKETQHFSSTARAEYSLLLNIKTGQKRKNYWYASSLNVDDKVKIIKRKGFLGFDYLEINTKIEDTK